MNVSFRTKLLASHVAVALIVSAVTLVVVERSVSERLAAQLDKRLESQALALTEWLEGAGHPNRLARRLAGVVGARVTVFDERSEAVGDSSRAVRALETPEDDDRPMIEETVRSGQAQYFTRFSAVSRESVRFVAVPAPNRAAIRLGFPLGEIEATQSQVRYQLALVGGLSVLLAIMLAALLGWPLSTRIGQATSYARHVANGNYDAVLPTGQQDEMGVLVATLRDAANELRRTDERRREFLANIAHELRTPVTSIRGFAETLLSTGSGPNKAQEFLPVIHRNALRIGKLVDDLLELEAIEAGGTPVSKETFLLEPLAHTVAKTLEQLAEDSGVTLEVEVPSDVEVTADPEALERILLNLADNAVRHGGGCVRLQAESRTRSTVVSVSDEGEGIPPEERSVVFERFQRGSHARRTGTGLGLAIARQLAHSLDATLRLVPTTRGTRFELEMSRG